MISPGKGNCDGNGEEINVIIKLSPERRIAISSGEKRKLSRSPGARLAALARLPGRFAPGSRSREETFEVT